MEYGTFFYSFASSYKFTLMKAEVYTLMVNFLATTETVTLPHAGSVSVTNSIAFENIDGQVYEGLNIFC